MGDALSLLKFSFSLNNTLIIMRFELIGRIAKNSLGELFGLITLTFSPFPNLLQARRSHAAVHYNDTVVVMGGYGKKDLRTV